MSEGYNKQGYDIAYKDALKIFNLLPSAIKQIIHFNFIWNMVKWYRHQYAQLSRYSTTTAVSPNDVPLAHHDFVYVVIKSTFDDVGVRSTLEHVLHAMREKLHTYTATMARIKRHSASVSVNTSVPGGAHYRKFGNTALLNRAERSDACASGPIDLVPLTESGLTTTAIQHKLDQIRDLPDSSNEMFSSQYPINSAVEITRRNSNSWEDAIITKEYTRNKFDVQLASDGTTESRVSSVYIRQPRSPSTLLQANGYL